MTVSNEDLGVLLEVSTDNKLLRDRVCSAFLVSVDGLKNESTETPPTSIEAQRKQFAQRALTTTFDRRLLTTEAQQLAAQPLFEGVYRNFIVASNGEADIAAVRALADGVIQGRVNAVTDLLAEDFSSFT